MPRRRPETADGRSRRWDEHRSARRAELVAAATTAIDRHGPTASIAQIAAVAGVSKPVLYRYFHDKDDLYAAVGHWGVGQLLDRIVPVLTGAGTIRDKTYAACAEFFGLIAEHPQVFLLLVEHHDTDDPLADGKVLIASTFAAVIEDLQAGAGLDPGGAQPWAHGLVGLGLSMGEWWIRGRPIDQDAAARYLGDFVWHGFHGIAAEHGVALDRSPDDAPNDAPNDGPDDGRPRLVRTEPEA